MTPHRPFRFSLPNGGLPPRRHPVRDQWALLTMLDACKLLVRAQGQLRAYDLSGHRDPWLESIVRDDPEARYDLRLFFAHGWTYWSVRVGFINRDARHHFKLLFGVDICQASDTTPPPQEGNGHDSGRGEQ